MECHLKKHYYQSASYHKSSQAAWPERYFQTNDHSEPIFDVPLNDMLITRTLMKEKRWRHSTSFMLNKTKMFVSKLLRTFIFLFASVYLQMEDSFSLHFRYFLSKNKRSWTTFSCVLCVTGKKQKQKQQKQKQKTKTKTNKKKASFRLML